MAPRRPRIERSGYLAWIRDLPCVICGTDQNIEAAHIRFSEYAAGKPTTGAGTKPHDAFTLPVCQRHHTWGPEAQHNARCGEREWWRSHNIDPIRTAALLWLHFTHGDRASALQVVSYASQYANVRDP